VKGNKRRSREESRNTERGHTKWVCDIAEWVVLRRWLREPDITSVTAEVARLDCLSNIFLNDDGATRSVDKPRAYEELN
jgi:hypothetical protein